MSKFLVSSVLFLTVVSSASAAPGASHAHGDTLEGWMLAAFESHLGGGDDGRDGKVVHLPIPEGVPTSNDPFTLTGEVDVTLAPGDAFTLPMFFAIGEQYASGFVPDPASLDDALFTGALVEVAIDDRVVLSSEDDDLADYLVGPAWFDDTIVYATPYYGAIGAVWIKGLGYVGEPLPVGEHVIQLYVYSPDVGIAFDNTWNVTVSR